VKEVAPCSCLVITYGNCYLEFHFHIHLTELELFHQLLNYICFHGIQEYLAIITLIWRSIGSFIKKTKVMLFCTIHIRQTQYFGRILEIVHRRKFYSKLNTLYYTTTRLTTQRTRMFMQFQVEETVHGKLSIYK